MQGECQDELAAVGQQLASGLQALTSAVEFGDAAIANQCCAAIVAALGSLQAAVQAAIAGIPAEPPTTLTIDLTPVTEAIAVLGAAVAAANAQEAGCCAKIDADLQAIAAAMPAGVDVKPIADALNTANAMNDIPEPFLGVLKKYFDFPPDIAAALQGAASVSLHGGAAAMAATDPAGTVEKWFHDEIDPHGTIARWVKAFWKGGMADLAASLEGWLKVLKKELVDTLHQGARDFLDPNDSIVQEGVKWLIEILGEQLKPAKGFSTRLGDIGVNPDKPVGNVASVALTSAVLAWIASSAHVDWGESLTKMAEYIAALVGFEEIRDVVISPLIRHGLAAVADMNARSLFRQHLPRGQDATEWLARGLITPEFARRLLNFDGFGDEIQPPAIAAAQTGINPRQLLRMLPTGLLTSQDVTDELTFNGLRQVSQHRFQLVAPYLATERQRSQLRTALEEAFVAGLLADGDYTAQLDSAEQNFVGNDLQLRAAKWKRLVAQNKDLEGSYATLFEAGLLDDAAYHSNLEGIGLQPNMVSVKAARAEARLEAALQRSTIREAAALARATAAEERRVAVKGIATGKLPAAGALAALVATGLTPVQAAAWTALAELGVLGNQHVVFGLPLNPADASLLRSRVAALTSQFEAALITPEQYAAGLRALKLPDVWVNALRAGAVRKIAPPKGLLVVPLTTS